MLQKLQARLARAFRPGKRKGVSVLIGALILVGLWMLSPVQAIQSLASLSDPDKLATLDERGANARVNKIVFWLWDARAKGIAPEKAIRWAQSLNRTKEPRASLVKESLLKNLQIADELLLFTPGNREQLRRGQAAKIARGPYAGQSVEIDHIVPYSLAPEIGNELANLEMLPQTVNRQKSNHITTRQLVHAQRLFDAGLMKQESMQRVRAATEKSALQDEKVRPFLLQQLAPPPPVYIFAMMLSPNSEHLISVAPSIKRAKS